MPTTDLYDSWQKKVAQTWPEQGAKYQRLMSELLVGLYLAGSVQLSKIALEIPRVAVLPSVVRMLERLLNNGHIRVREWYRPLIEPVIKKIARQKREIRLIIDGSKVGNGHQLLMVGIAYRSRAIPVAWTWVRCRRGHSSSYKQRCLMSYVHSLLPPNVPVLLVGDSEFGNIELIRLLERWQWYYVLRQKGSHQVQNASSEEWVRMDEILSGPGERQWLFRVRFTKKHAHLTNLLAHWAKGEKEPWLLATNLPTRRQALQAYRRRPWIEGLFGDLKGKGFDLESSRLRHFLRLSRLTLALSILYLWSVFTGAAVIKNGERRLVDRRDRRDLSLFQIGLRWTKRRLLNRQPVIFYLTPT